MAKVTPNIYHGMEVQLTARARIISATILFDSVLDVDDRQTHRVVVEGTLAHFLFPEAEDARLAPGTREEKFQFNFLADRELCDAIQKLIEKNLAKHLGQPYPQD